MQRRRDLNRAIVDNLIWFGASLLLAFVIWVIATNQADPVDVRTFPTIPVQIRHDESLLVVNDPRSTVRVDVRAQESVRNALRTEDITVIADLEGRGPGTYTVELETDITRRAVADTLPSQITVVLEEEQARLVQVEPNITGQPPLPYEGGTPQFSETEIEVSGAASRVEQVVAVRVQLDLSEARNDFAAEVTLTPIDVDGSPVNGLNLSPETIRVTVPVSPRTDVRRVSIQPDIRVDTLQEGYTFSAGIELNPTEVFLSGDDLSAIPDTLSTAEISLEGQTSDFEVTVPVLLPPGVDEDDVLFLGERNVTVRIPIAPVITTRQFEAIPVTVIGLEDNLQAQLVPAQVSILLEGPEAQLDEIEAEDIDVVVDLNGLGPGTYDNIIPDVIVNTGQLEAVVLPATVTVTISGEAEATEDAAP